MKLKVLYLDHFRGKEIKKSFEDSGYDLYASINEPLTLKPMEIKTIPLGISIEVDGNCPEGFNWGLRITGRSGLNSKGLLATVGTIDSGYRGELKTTIINLSGEDYTFEPGDRVCQLLVVLKAHCEVVKVEDIMGFSDSKRKTKAFGSSGR